MSDSSRQMGERDDLHAQRTMFMPAGQMEQSEDSADRTRFDPQNDAVQGQQNASEDHGSLEPDDSRNVTGASGTAGVGAPGGSDQQTGGTRWGGGQQGQATPASTPDAAGQPQGEQVEFDADPTIERQGEVEFEPAGELGSEARPARQMNQNFGASGQYGEQASGENAASDQMQQFETGSSGRAGEIREHMEVIGADGVHLGTVDKVEGAPDGNWRIKLTKRDSGMGAHEGHHHFISCGLVAAVDGDKVRLSATAATAYGMEEEE